jgi:hypothetical protein
MLSAVKNTVETFLVSKEHFSMGDKAKMVGALVALIVWILIVLLLSKWLWNKVLCSIVTFAKPVTSVFQIVGLVVLLAILKPN